MPSSVDGKYVEHKDDVSDDEPRNRADSKISNASSKKTGLSDKHSDRHSDDGHRDDFGHDDDGPVLTKKFHIIMILLIASTWICLLAIIPTRSLGLSGKLESGDGISIGFFKWCYADACSGAWIDEHDGKRTAGGTFGIIAIIISTVMLILQVLQMSKDQFTFFLKLQVLLNHALWICILISWTLWASIHNDIDSDATSSQLYYGWGFVFLVCIWLVQMFTAIHNTMKMCGMKGCC
eukprot:TRINITY_DN30729_c0_g1_i1.p1 TRINITY_DN30729_c0_g1~~TRINITY_DN30729_c0_g1_i1.p1  ORF type:complete len:252 (+),score=38.78 TRINITY_DN30729_c0_g1_i1:49-756(+)